MRAGLPHTNPGLARVITEPIGRLAPRFSIEAMSWRLGPGLCFVADANHCALCRDTVNTASRMESNCPRPGCIHASQSTFELLDFDGDIWTPTGGVDCKGKGIIQSYVLSVTEEALQLQQQQQQGGRASRPDEGRPLQQQRGAPAAA